MMINLILFEDHALMREGLKELFEHVEDIHVAAETDHGLTLMNLLFEHKFDLILMDISVPGVDTFDLAQRIAVYPQHPPILILSMHSELQTARRMFKLGVKGYITKNSSSEELVGAVRKVAKGARYVGSDLSEYLFFEPKVVSQPSNHLLLSKRQLSILKLLVEGHKPTEIAIKLNLSVKTVSTHKINIKNKLNIESDADLIRYAINQDMQ